VSQIKHFQALIEDELNSLQYNSQPAELYDPIKYILSLGGKRMRPVLVLTGCDLFGGDIHKAIKPALGIEVFHNFTLLHDDIMDKAPLRRNKQTVHEKWNVNTAILSGDTMFVQAFQLMMKVEDNVLRKTLDLFNKTAIEVCEGQQTDMVFEQRHKVSIPQYIKMIELKTAVLLAASLKTGALIGGAREEDARALYEFGKNIGIAFQLQDDILDVYGKAEKFGKQAGGDIISNKKTFLLLKAMEMANKYMSEELQGWINAPEFKPTEKVEAVTSIYNFLGVKALAEKEMNRYYSRAMDSLKSIPVGEEKKQGLIAFADSLMVREV